MSGPGGISRAPMYQRAKKAYWYTGDLMSQSMKSSKAAVWFSAIVLTTSSCRDASAPIETPIVGSVTAASLTSLTGVVATNVETPPSVLVRDTNGKPMPDVVVQFVPAEGSGTLSGSTAISNSSGIATLGAWKLGTVAGLQSVTAQIRTSLFVVFPAIALAGPAAAIVKLDGDNQVANSGTPVRARPRVKVTDSYENPVGGVAVKFVVESGGGSLTGDNSITDWDGIATLDSWTLGGTGEQTVVASAGALSPLTFLARAIDWPVKCPASELGQDCLAESELTDESPQADGWFFQNYTVTLTEPGTWQFRLTSTQFDTRLELRDQNGAPIAANRNDAATMNSQVRVLLPAGVFTLVVTSTAPAAVGRYAVSYTKGETAVAGCEISIVRGVQTDQRIVTNQCPRIDNRSIDRFRIYLTAGSVASIVLEDHSLSDFSLEIQDDNGQTVAVGVYRSYMDAFLNYGAPVDGYYVIGVQAVEAYLLSVK